MNPRQHLGKKSGEARRKIWETEERGAEEGRLTEGGLAGEGYTPAPNPPLKPPGHWRDTGTGPEP